MKLEEIYQQPSRQDMMDALDHMSDMSETGQPLSIDDFNTKYLGMLDADKLAEYDDLDSWVEIFHDPDATPEENYNELLSYRGQAWADRALTWVKNGIPPIIIVTLSDGYTAVGDGRGRVNFATLFNMKVPVYHMEQKE